MTGLADRAAEAPELEAEFRTAMRHLAGAVNIVTSGRGESRRGLTVTAVCSVTTEPPTLLVCVNRSAEAHDVIRAEGRFCVNVLALEDAALADRFAARDGSKGAVRFEGRDWTEITTGAPALSDARVAVDCTVANRVDAGTHSVFFGRVEGVRHRPDTAPLAYHDRAYRRLV